LSTEEDKKVDGEVQWGRRDSYMYEVARTAVVFLVDTRSLYWLVKVTPQYILVPHEKVPMSNKNLMDQAVSYYILLQDINRTQEELFVSYFSISIDSLS